MTRIAVVGGDGTGPEVVAEALKALDAAAGRFGLNLEYVPMDLSGSRYLRTGEVLTEADLEQLRSVDAVLLGAIGHPDVAPGTLERGVLLRIRGELNQYINLRPIRLYPGVVSPVVGLGPEDVDMVVVRENSEGLYAGSGRIEGEGTPDEVAIQESINTRSAIERCARYAFELAQGRPRRLVTLVGKTNVLTYAWGLWERVTRDVAAEYPAVTLDYANVDAACLWLVEDPGRFDVIVTDNMFGDIITDLGAAIQGGLGVASGANINPEGVSMFEPIGGTAPGFEGTGKINPLAAIGAAAMLLTELGITEAGDAVERAVAEVAGSLPSLRAGEMGLTTSQVGDRVAALVGG